MRCLNVRCAHPTELLLAAAGPAPAAAAATAVATATITELDTSTHTRRQIAGTTIDILDIFLLLASHPTMLTCAHVAPREAIICSLRQEDEHRSAVTDHLCGFSHQHASAASTTSAASSASCGLPCHRRHPTCHDPTGLRLHWHAVLLATLAARRTARMPATTPDCRMPPHEQSLHRSVQKERLCCSVDSLADTSV